MKKGVLLFAHNNEQINYGLMAYWQAERVRKHLGVSCSLVTDQTTIDVMDAIDANWRNSFDKIILQDSVATQTKRYGPASNQLTFHNLDRSNAWDLTPYDETIVMDTDIVIQTPTLSKLWNSAEDLIICDTSTDLYGETPEEFKWVSERSIKFYWATIFFFRKTPETELFFKECNRVKQNYSWLSFVYELPSGPVRNDFVWSIVAHSLDHSIPTIPFNLLHSNFEDRVIDMTANGVKFLTPNGLCKVKQDVHVFNKFDLMEQIKKEIQ